MSDLHQLADVVGVQRAWRDANGRAMTVDDAVLSRVLGALGFETKGANLRSSLIRARLERAGAEQSFVSGQIGEALILPEDFRDRTGLLRLERGSEQSVRLDGRALHVDFEPGYHALEIGTHVITIAMAPEQCLSVADVTRGRKVWAPAVQIPSLRDERSRSFGDFGTLADAAACWARAGCDGLAISPVHALFPADAARFSPYAPSSRLFLNVFFADPAILGREMPPKDVPDLIDWNEAIPAKMKALREVFGNRSGSVRSEVARYREAGGIELEQHGQFDALHAFFFSMGARGWSDWPRDFHDAGSAAVARFASEHAEDIEFFVFCQWLADKSLNNAQRAARDNGMAIGLISDLAVGMDGGGSHAWSRRADVLTGLSIGAPPDILGPDGQNWGITGFSPFALRSLKFEPYIATLRTALRHAGGIRIDHALGLNRLWIIPDGSAAGDGAYLTYPLTDMLRILAIESHRADAIVIGEDLGTVPEGLRTELDDRAIFGMRVLPFEQDEGGHLRPADEWSPKAAALTGTHDLPTIAGWWCGRDIDWTWALGRSSQAPSEEAARETRNHERMLWWDSFVEADIVEGQAPERDDPVPAVDAATTYVATTPCEIAILPIEDILGLIEQPNLPGTTDEHPNWRRRMPGTNAAVLDHPDVRKRIAMINEARKA